MTGDRRTRSLPASAYIDLQRVTTQQTSKWRSYVHASRTRVHRDQSFMRGFHSTPTVRGVECLADVDRPVRDIEFSDVVIRMLA